jgi:hypothetical protein
MRLIPIQNNRFLAKLDYFAQAFYKRPHTFYRSPKPDVSFSTLNTYKADSEFVGYPKEHNYTDFVGANAYVVKPGKVRWQDMRHWILKAFQHGIPNAETEEWYYDTMCIQPPEVGFTGWHNNKNKPHHSIRLIHNSGRGYSIERVGNKQIKYKDQHSTSRAGAKDWTCLYSYYPSDGSVWFADRNLGDKPRLVLDLAIAPKYGRKAEAALAFISNTFD